jgi:hypothetical protein
MMNKIWADRLVAGTRKWKEVPKSRKTAVKDILLEMVNDGTITKERYQEIVGEKVPAEA